MVEAGGLYHRSNHAPKDQVEGLLLKAGLAAELLALSGVDAMGLAPNDLAVGWDQVKALAGKHTLPYVVSNLSCGLDRPFPASRVVERNGIRVGFVGAYVGAFTGDGCTVDDPIAATASAVNALPEVDAVVVLGAFSTEKGQELAAAAPRVSFVVSSDNVNLPDPKPLTPDVWLLGTGSRGKNLGVLQATLVPEAKGWQTLRPGASVAERIERFRARLKTAQERQASATDEAARKRTERQVEFYQKEIARMESELEAVALPRTTVANTFTSELVSLGRSIIDHAATRARLDAMASELARFEERPATPPVQLGRPPVPLGVGPASRSAAPKSPEAPKAAPRAPSQAPAGG